MARLSFLSASEVASHKEWDNCWIVIENEVWDVSKFAPEHPGGPLYSTNTQAETPQTDFPRGFIDQSSIPSRWKTQYEGNAGSSYKSEEGEPLLDDIFNSSDFEKAAATWASKKAYTFYSTADTDCWTRDANTAMLRRIWFRPRVMRDVVKVDTSGSMLGIPMSLPLCICPTGWTRLIHSDAEKALARAAKSTGILEIISTSAGYPTHEIVSQAPDYPFLFQLYMNKQRQKSAEALSKAKSLGIKAIFVTVDAAGRGKRESDERLSVDEVIISPTTGERIVPDKKGAGLTRSAGSYIDQSLNWKDIAWIREQTELPIILKGIGCAADAKLAMEHKVDGVLLGNHGGRNLDYSPPSILILLEMHKICPEIFDKMEVYVDGGFRRGADVLKALCLGAKAVGIGRTFLYALHYGTEGVEHLVQIIKDEMESAMKLIGITNLSQVHAGLVNTSDIDHLVPNGEDHPYVKWRPSSKL